MILSTFTFWYKPQTHTYKKSDFSLPEDKFLIIVSGGRLTDEVTYDFLYEIREIFNYNAHILYSLENLILMSKLYQKIIF